MHLQSVSIHGFRSLRDRVIGQLSAGVTILHSADSETRGDFVEFLRAVFTQRGADMHGGLWHAGHSAAGSVGEIELQSGEKLSLTAPATARLLPDWVDDVVFREICTPGTAESSRFERLLQLCRASDQRLTLDAERRQAEQGLERIRAERDGNGLSGGLVHRISELRRQQGEVQGRIAALRKPAEAQATRIRELEQQHEETAQQLELLVSEKTRLHERVCQLESVQRFRASQTSGATATETAESLGQWKAITALMARELSVCRRQESGQLAGEALHLLQPKVEASGERIFSQRAAAMQLCLQQATAVAELLQTELRSLTDAAAAQKPVDDGLRSLADAELQSALAAAHAAHDSATTELERVRAVATMTAESLERLRADLQPTLTLETLDQLRAAIAELEAETAQLEEQRRRLNQSEETLRDLLVAFAERPVFSLLEVAGVAVRRATGGEVRELRWGADGSLLAAIGGQSQAIPLAEVDAAVQDLIGLVLRLSLLQLKSQSGTSVPLILNGVHLYAGDSWSAGTAAMLESFAAAGQQILVLTESCDLPEQQGRWLDVRAFPEPTAVQEPPQSVAVLQAPVAALPVVPEPVTVAEPLPVTAELQTDVVESPAVLVSEPVAAVQAAEVAAEPLSVAAAAAAPLLQLHVADDVEAAIEDRQAGNWLFYLEADHGVDDLAGISLGELEALRTAGVQTIRELLGHTIPELEQLIRLKGFVVPVERLQALWGQAELAARVPLLRRGDAALLFAAGIHTAEELSRLRPETVYERVTRFQRSDAGARYRRAGRLIDRQQALNWARFGQFLRSLEDVYSTRSRFGAKTISKPAVRAAARRTAGGGVQSSAVTAVSAAVVPDAGVTEENPAVPVTKKRRRRVATDSAVASRRAKRTARREQLTGEHRVEQAETDGGQQVAERVGGMRFFLSRTSSVAVAPSIGPRTAELLQAAGLRTVEEFLSMTPERVSEKLHSRRITATIVRQWQAQARLMCQIPELRAVDAQILVACGIVTPEALSERRPEQVLSSVQPLADSAEGQKLLKTAGQPDLATVTAWIQWAANARPFRAA